MLLLSMLPDQAIMGAGNSPEQGPGKIAAATQHPEGASSLGSQSRARQSQRKLILEFAAAFSIRRGDQFTDCADGI